MAFSPEPTALGSAAMFGHKPEHMQSEA